MNVGEIWYVRNKANHSPTVDLVEILYLNGNVVGFGDECYDIRLLDFVERDYEEEERRAQEKFMETLVPIEAEPEQVESTPTKPSWWTRLKIWWITRVA